MKNILSVSDYGTIIERINRLNGTDKQLWGGMTVDSMVTHLSDQIRVCLGDIQVKSCKSWIGKVVIKRLVLLGLPPAKEKIKTFDEIEPLTGAGTAPTVLSKDIAGLKDLIDRFIQSSPADQLQSHTVFGSLSRKEWGRLIYIHLDYHLKQFGR